MKTRVGLTDSSRRQLVNIVVAHITEVEGKIPHKETKDMYAHGIITLFPALRDPYTKKGYILQDFSLLFGSETASKFLEKLSSSFKDKVIKEVRTLKVTPFLLKLIKSVAREDGGFDAGRKRALKISVLDGVDHLVKFHKSCQSLDDHLAEFEGNHQPYLLATGMTKADVQCFYIVMDRNLIPCQASTTLAAFDELFKAHFVFGVKYDESLCSLFTFVQTTIYNIDIGRTKESPKVRELRAKLLN
ncbi:uncharacterized protein LOC136751670 [Amia ocellicauda]|uniref:uncharacterized protein LOC136751670 n=1 Tax=Amia ocellicauda TaxID=2972642 RepID=UPI003464E736